MDPADHLVTGQSGIAYDWNIIYMFLDKSSLQLCKNSIQMVWNRDDDEGFRRRRYFSYGPNFRWHVEGKCTYQCLYL